MTTQWITGHHLPHIAKIDLLSFENSWDVDDFDQELKGRKTIGLVAKVGHRVVGFIIYELHSRLIKVIRLAVHPNYRERGIGRELLRKISSKLNCIRKSAIFDVPDDNLPAHKWLRACGWRAEAIRFEPTYRFSFTVAKEDECEQQAAREN